MKTQQKMIALTILALALLGPALWLWAIDWIQYNERVSGENSPLYDDVLNRPAKQIWGVYTSEHNTDGTHRLADIFPTPLPTATPVVLPTPLPTATPVVFPTPLPTATPRGDPTPQPTATPAPSINFTVEHNVNGTHATPIPAPGQQYALSGSGSTTIAYGTFAQNTQLENTKFSVYGVVLVRQLARAEKFYSRINTQYSQTRFSFGKTADNKLTVALGTNTYTSAAAVFTADNLNVPIEVGVICDRSANTIAFFYEGKTDATIAVSFAGIPANNGYNEVFNLGDGLDGALFFWSFSKTALFAANALHTPLREGLSQCPQCVWHYNMNEGSGLSLIDRYAHQKGTTLYSLSLNAATWVVFVQGY